jgi:hypothetical protein
MINLLEPQIELLAKEYVPVQAWNNRGVYTILSSGNHPHYKWPAVARVHGSNQAIRIDTDAKDVACLTHYSDAIMYVIIG